MSAAAAQARPGSPLVALAGSVTAWGGRAQQRLRRGRGSAEVTRGSAAGSKGKFARNAAPKPAAKNPGRGFWNNTPNSLKVRLAGRLACDLKMHLPPRDPVLSSGAGSLRLKGWMPGTYM